MQEVEYTKSTVKQWSVEAGRRGPVSRPGNGYVVAVQGSEAHLE